MSKIVEPIAGGVKTVPVVRGEAEWRELLAEFARSGQSQKAFCAERGLSTTTLRSWRNRLEAGRSRGFVEIAPPAGPDWDVELSLGADVVLRLRRV